MLVRYSTGTLKNYSYTDASACITEPRPLECFHASLTLLWKMSETFKIDGPNLGALVLSRSRAYTAILYGYNKQDTEINLY